jgi:hypothetical protein
MAYITTAAAALTAISAAKSAFSGDKNGGAGAQSDSRDPWAAAQPYLKQNLETNKGLQDYYAQNPFSDLQKQQYQGLFNTLANNQAAGAGLLANASAFGQSKGGRLPTLQSMPTGTQAPAIDWASMNPYNSQGMKDMSTKQNAPTTYRAGQSNDPLWEQILGNYNKASMERFGTPMNRDWNADSDAQAQYQVLLNQYLDAKKAQTPNGLLG